MIRSIKYLLNKLTGSSSSIYDSSFQSILFSVTQFKKTVNEVIKLFNLNFVISFFLCLLLGAKSLKRNFSIRNKLNSILVSILSKFISWGKFE